MRRLVQAGSALITFAALAIVLYNATLVDRTPPNVARIALSAIAAGDAHLGLTLTAIDVEFSEAVRRDTVESRFTISPAVSGAFAWDGPTTLIFTPSQRLPPETAFTVRMVPGFEDVAGNASTDSPSFAFRTVGPPVVVSTDPASDAAGVPVGAAIHLTFDRLMDTSAVESAIAIDPGSSMKASWNGPSLTLTPIAPFQFGTMYTLTIGTDAADTDGSHMADGLQLRFTTVSIGLEAKTIVPAPDSSGVSIRTPIALVFDHPIDPASIINALTITPAVAGSLQLEAQPQDPASPAATTPQPTASASQPSGSGTVLLFTPSGPLQPHTTYTVSLSPTVRPSDAPDVVARDMTWSFTTGQPTTSAQNQIAFLSARDGTQNVWLMNPDGSNPREITTEIAPVTSFDVRGDGQLIAYAVAGTVVTMRMDGSGRTTLTQSGRFEYGPTFSPDGGSVLLSRRDNAGNDLGYWLVPVPGNIASGERQVLPEGAPPLGVPATGGLDASGAVPPWMARAAFSGDGRLVLIVTASGTPQLVDLASDSAVTMTLPITATSGPVWSSDAAGFVVVGEESDRRGAAVYAIRRSGLSSQVDVGFGSVAVSTSGGIATIVHGQVPGSAHVAFAAESAGSLFALTTANDLVDRSPAFAPDGGSILFVRAQASSPTQSNGIWTVGLDGRELRQLSTDGIYPRWLP